MLADTTVRRIDNIGERPIESDSSLARPNVEDCNFHLFPLDLDSLEDN